MQRASALLDSAERRWISLPERGIDVALLDWGGSGPIVLAHHANGFCKGLWGEVAEAVRAECRVIAMDARGHGDTRFTTQEPAFGWDVFAEDALAVARALCAGLGVDRIDLGVGHSFGGTSMLGAAASEPERFGGLLLLDPVTPPPDEVPGRAAHVLQLVERARKRRADWPSRDEARSWFEERDLFAGWRPTALDLYVLDGLRDESKGQVVLKCSPDVEAAVFRGGALDLDELARRASAPCLWVWAERGNFDRDRHRELAGRMAQGRFESWPVGHLIPMERPDRVAAAILDRTGTRIG